MTLQNEARKLRIPSCEVGFRDKPHSQAPQKASVCVLRIPADEFEVREALDTKEITFGVLPHNIIEPEQTRPLLPTLLPLLLLLLLQLWQLSVRHHFVFWK